MCPAPLAYKRVILKISGEGFCKPGQGGIDSEALNTIAERLKSVSELGAELAVVVGGGNIIRGAQFARNGVPRATADRAATFSPRRTPPESDPALGGSAVGAAVLGFVLGVIAGRRM